MSGFPKIPTTREIAGSRFYALRELGKNLDEGATELALRTGILRAPPPIPPEIYKWANGDDA